MDDTSVAEYLGITDEQARQIRIRPPRAKLCPGCTTVHQVYPSVSFHHSPICRDQYKCSICNGPLFSETISGQEVGLICEKCHGVEERDDA